MEFPRIYRKRFIPNEIVYLKNDKIIKINKEIIVTEWYTLNPRSDFNKGKSCYFFNEGYKVSNFYKDKELLYTYCDIIETEFDKKENKYIFSDLLVDVIIYPNNFVKVLDIEEISQALTENLITIEQAKNALVILSKLLEIIYSGRLSELKTFL